MKRKIRNKYFIKNICRRCELRPNCIQFDCVGISGSVQNRERQTGLRQRKRRNVIKFLLCVILIRRNFYRLVVFWQGFNIIFIYLYIVGGYAAYIGRDCIQIRKENIHNFLSGSRNRLLITLYISLFFNVFLADSTGFLYLYDLLISHYPAGKQRDKSIYKTERVSCLYLRMRK